MFRAKPDSLQESTAPPADEANNAHKKEDFKVSYFTHTPLMQVNTISVYIYLFDLQATRNCRTTVHHSGDCKSSTAVGKEIHYLAADPVAGQQCVVRLFPSFKNKKRSTPLYCR